jgi:hypothetical protein
LHAAEGNSKDRLPEQLNVAPAKEDGGERATHRQPNSILVPQQNIRAFKPA